MNEHMTSAGELIDSTSLGTKGARTLRSQTPSEEVDGVLQYAGDIEVVQRARAAGRGSYEARYLEDTLREVGLGTLINLQRKNLLFTELAKRNIRLAAPRPVFLAHARSVYFLSVLGASRRFMNEAVFGGGWSPAMGASLRTFFVNRCLYSFAEEYQRFYREERSPHEISVATYLDLEAPAGSRLDRQGPPPNPEDVAVARDEIERLLEGANETAATMFFLTAEGYTQKEIAEVLGITAEAVSSAMRRFRRYRRALQAGSED